MSSLQLRTTNITPFIDSFRMPLSRFHRRKLEKIDGFDYSRIQKKMSAEFPCIQQDYLDRGINALKQYYAVALLDPKNEHAVSVPVDPFWHNHILFTRDYVRFCDEVFNQFIHHEPLDKTDTQQVDKVLGLYEYTKEVYQQLFKNIDSEMWPTPSLDSVICSHHEVYDPTIRRHSLLQRRAA